MKEAKKTVTAESQKQTEVKDKKRKVSKAWEAAQRLKGSVIINDPTLFAL